MPWLFRFLCMRIHPLMLVFRLWNLTYRLLTQHGHGRGYSDRGRGRNKFDNHNKSSSFPCTKRTNLPLAPTQLFVNIVGIKTIRHAIAGTFLKALVAWTINSNFDSRWHPNTGATHHMSTEVNHYQSDYRGSDAVIVGNGVSLAIHGACNMPLPPSTREFKLNDVLYVLEIKKNILSVRRFAADNRCYFEFYPHKFNVKDMQTGKIFFQGRLKIGHVTPLLKQLPINPLRPLLLLLG